MVETWQLASDNRDEAYENESSERGGVGWEKRNPNQEPAKEKCLVELAGGDCAGSVEPA